MVFSCSSRAPVAPGEDLPGALAGRPPFPVATSVATSVVSRTSLCRTPWCLRIPLASGLSPVGDDVCVRSPSSRPPRQALILRHICRLPTEPVRAAARCPLHFCFVARLAGARLLAASGFAVLVVLSPRPRQLPRSTFLVSSPRLSPHGLLLHHSSPHHPRPCSGVVRPWVSC